MDRSTAINNTAAEDRVRIREKGNEGVCCGLTEFLTGELRFRSFRLAIDASIQLTEIFRQLHERGCCFRSFRTEDLKLFTDTGRAVLLRERADIGQPGGTTGLVSDPRYQAPEILRGVASPGPGSDRHLLAVLIYQFLTGGDHPLEGRRSVGPVMTGEMQAGLYRNDPVFLYDPARAENRPDPKLHYHSIALWEALPEMMRSMFLQAFGSAPGCGLADPEARPSEEAWCDALMRLQNGMIPCGCGKMMFDAGGETLVCASCGAQHRIRYRIELPGLSIPAVRGNRIYGRQIGARGEEGAQPAARIIAAQSDASRLGLQNISTAVWEAETTKGKRKSAGPDEVIPLKDGIQIGCGSVTMRIAAVRSERSEDGE